MVGGFLIALAAVGIFAAYTSATAPPRTSYAIAGRDLPVGTVLTGREVRFVPLDLPPEMQARAVPEASADQLRGLITLGPLRSGDLLLESNLVRPGGQPRAEKLSVPLPASRALMDQLRVGEVVDVVATYSGGSFGDFTAYVARRVQVVAIDDGGTSVGEPTKVYTLAVTHPADVLAVAHAATTAEVFLVRSASGADGAETPPPYRPVT